MVTFCLICDLRRGPDADYSGLEPAVVSLGQCQKLQKHAWIIRTTMWPKDIFNAVNTHLDSGDTMHLLDLTARRHFVFPSLSGDSQGFDEMALD